MADEQPDATQQPAPTPEPVTAPDPAPTAEPTAAPTADAAPAAQAVDNPEPVGNAPGAADTPVTDPASQPTPEDLTSQFKKDDLVTAAAVVGADVPSSATKQTIAEAIIQQATSTVATPVKVDNLTRRSDDDAMLGTFVDVINGPYAGRWGAYLDDLTNDPETGYPSVVLVRTRDADMLLIDVNYADIRPSVRTGGR